MKKIQKLDWGTIQWIFEPGENAADNMRVGISTMDPGTYQPLHIHMGEEQLIYVISGHGWQKIDNQVSQLKPGSLFHISTGTAHESRNEGTEPIIKLLVSIPAIISAPKVAMNRSAKVQKQESIDRQEFLRETIRYIFRKMLSPLKMPLSIFSEKDELIYSNYEFPEFCHNCCQMNQDTIACPLYQKKVEFIPPYYSDASALICEHGISLYVLPIVYEGELLGYIKSGHVRTMIRDGEKGELPYNVPSSTVGGIISISHKLAEAICNHYQVCKMQVALQHSTRVLSDKEKEEMLLQESLKTTQGQMLNLRINQHFLFNTLNTIAGMAIRENAIETYQAVGNLSQLLRYTLRTNRFFVTLSEELDFVKNYTALQKTRFGNRLTVDYQIDPFAGKEEVPFNFLQPIVENCFKHGFKNKKDNMHLILQANATANYIQIFIMDNGQGMDASALASLRNKIQNSSAPHGTAMVVRKLDSLYGNNYHYHVDSSPEGTMVCIHIPIKERRNFHETNPFGG